MNTIATILFTIWLIGFVVVFLFHIFELQMVTLGLALFRSLLWPVWFATGWPRGTPLPMD